MKKKNNYPAPPELNEKEQARLEKCIYFPGRAYRFIVGAIELETFVVGHLANGDERSLVGYGWIDEYNGQKYVKPMVLVDNESRVYEVNGVEEMAILVNIIRKSHYRWLYDDYRKFWEEEMRTFEGPIYRDYKAEFRD